jgi:hypothetical protein
MSIRERSIVRWLREKWSLMFPGQVYILNSLGVPVAGQGVTVLPTLIQLSSRAPNSSAEWRCRWSMLTAEPGITLDHPGSTYTVVHIAAGTPPGRRVLECVYTRVTDDAEFSKQYFITVIDASKYE